MSRTNEQIKSQRALKHFILEFDLQNQYNVIEFNADIRITHMNQEGSFKCHVRIHFEYPNIGTLYFTCSEVDATVFPTKYIVDYNNFEFIDSIYLQIKGNHPTHGAYVTQVYSPVRTM